MIMAVLIILALIALYCFGLWLYVFVKIRTSPFFIEDTTDQQLESIELNTFHLGLCGILALGFIGLILTQSGY